MKIGGLYRNNGCWRWLTNEANKSVKEGPEYLAEADQYLYKVIEQEAGNKQQVHQEIEDVLIILDIA